MQIFHHVSSVREALAEERAHGRTIGFVPTMGNLHQAHLELVKIAQANCDVVVVSIFVNPLQFGLNEDWDKYPRTYEADVAKLIEVGCDYLFYPDETEIYPNGMAEQTRVVVPTMTDVLCGASRPGHFEGVTTVVSKLFNIVQPDVAAFGKKDYQQLKVIERMVRDLDMPVRILPVETQREDSGLALSSRNSYLTLEQKAQAALLRRTLQGAAERLRQGEPFAAVEVWGRQELDAQGFRTDYFSIRRQADLQAPSADDRKLVVLTAAWLGKTRLIDNLELQLNSSS